MMVALATGVQPAKVVNDGYGDYVLVPAGAFRMGDYAGDGDRANVPFMSSTSTRSTSPDSR